MVIKIERVPIVRIFDDIAVGDLFVINPECDPVLVKTETVKVPASSTGIINCVNIMTGELLSLNDKFPVRPLVDVEVHSKVLTE
jgi:hypothetical protein